MVYWPVAIEISFKDISIFSSGGQLNILINFGRRLHDEHLKLIYFGPVVKEERLFKDISYL